MADSKASRPRLRWELLQGRPVTTDRKKAEQRKGDVVLTDPGAYIEEEPSGVRTITGVAASIAPLIG